MAPRREVVVTVVVLLLNTFYTLRGVLNYRHNISSGSMCSIERTFCDETEKNPHFGLVVNIIRRHILKVALAS